MQQMQEIEQIEVFEIVVQGLPALDYPAINDEMADGTIINESNQKDYYTPFNRTEGECSLVDYDDVEIVEVHAKNDGLATMTIVGTSQQLIDDLTSFIIYDEVTDKDYTARIISTKRFLD